MIVAHAVGRTLRLVGMTGLLSLYTCLIRPFLSGQCLQTPSCRQYAYHAVVEKGLFKGGIQALKYLSSCWGGFYGKF